MIWDWEFRLNKYFHSKWKSIRWNRWRMNQQNRLQNGYLYFATFLGYDITVLFSAKNCSTKFRENNSTCWRCSFAQKSKNIAKKAKNTCTGSSSIATICIWCQLLANNNYKPNGIRSNGTQILPNLHDWYIAHSSTNSCCRNGDFIHFIICSYSGASYVYCKQ